MAEAPKPPRIYVLAGTNGAGKSSIAGAMFRAARADYFNPDEAARRIQTANPGLTQVEANGVAWNVGRRLLERAMGERLDYAFETTLGGNTITALLERAAAAGIEVRVWYVGLNSPELHLARVRLLIMKGGHDIPESDVRRRYNSSRLNLIRLLPKLSELRVFDNSAEGDPSAPSAGTPPQPKLLLHVRAGQGVSLGDGPTPDWARPIVAAALKLK